MIQQYSTVLRYSTHLCVVAIVGAAALGIPALDQSFGINVSSNGSVDRAI